MTFKNIATQFILLGAIGGTMAMPLNANAQNVGDWLKRQTKSQHRQNQKNNWRNLGLAGAGVAVVGLLTHNSALTAIGVAGGLYSAYRYEQDRKSQSAADRRRYAYFSKKSRVIDGHRYHRVTVMKQGHKYYAYKRG